MGSRIARSNYARYSSIYFILTAIYEMKVYSSLTSRATSERSLQTLWGLWRDFSHSFEMTARLLHSETGNSSLEWCVIRVGNIEIAVSDEVFMSAGCWASHYDRVDAVF